MTVEQDILQKYPQYAYFMNDPELRYLAIYYLDPAKPFDSGAYTASLMQTTWWKTHNGTQRDLIQQAALDPATVEQHMQVKIDQLRGFSMDGGLNLTEPQLRWEASLALQNGWTDTQAKRSLIEVAAQNGQTGLYQGSIGNAAQQVRSLAAQMAVPISEQSVTYLAQNMWQGNTTADAIKTNLAQQAIHAYGMQNPELARALNEGQTVRGWLDPQIQSVATELEMGADQIDLTAPKWSPLLNYNPDPKVSPRVMTVPEAQVWARQQTEYQYTKGAQDKAYGIVDSLTKAMGERR